MTSALRIYFNPLNAKYYDAQLYELNEYSPEHFCRVEPLVKLSLSEINSLQMCMDLSSVVRSGVPNKQLEEWRTIFLEMVEDHYKRNPLPRIAEIFCGGRKIFVKVFSEDKKYIYFCYPYHQGSIIEKQLYTRHKNPGTDHIRPINY